MSSAARAATAVAVLLAIAACCVAAAIVGEAYRGSAFLAAGLGAVGTGAGTALLIRRGRARRCEMAAVAVAALGSVWVAAILAVPDRAVLGILPTLDAVAQLGVAGDTGWKSVFTAAAPLGTGDGLLVPSYLAVYAATSWSALAAPRLRAVFGPFALAVYGVAIGVGAPGAARGIGLALVVGALAAGCAAGAPKRSVRGAVAPGARRSTGFVLAACLIGGAVAAAVVPVRSDRVHAQGIVVPAVDPSAVGSPLSAFRGWFGTERRDQELFSASGVAEGTRFTLATLDSYDGVAAGVGAGSAADFRRVSSGPPPEGSSVRITIAALDSVWLPLTDDAQAPSLSDAGAAVSFSAAGGTALSDRPLRPGTVIRAAPARRATVSLQQLADATPGADRRLDRTADSAAIDAFFDTASSGGVSPGERLRRSLSVLLDRGYRSHGADAGDEPSRSGHSIARLEELVSGSTAVGDDEQFAVLAALFADRAGFPARVAVGFTTRAVEGGTARIRGRDAAAWLEVSVAGHGWVRVDVTPERSGAPAVAETSSPAARPQAVVAPPAPQSRAEVPDQHAASERPSDPVLPTTRSSSPLLGVLAVVCAALIVSPPLVILLVKRWRRRRRRRAADPRDRVLGAWADYLDHARDRGIPVPRSGTRPDIARGLGDPRAVTLARLADRASFDPLPFPAVEADRVWLALGGLRDGPGAPASRLERIRWALSPASLRPVRRR